MAKNNAGDILTCDWNPVIGCERYSAGCARCWYLDGLFPWQQRLGNIPAGISRNEHHVFPKRLPQLVRIKGTRIIMLEPLLGPVDLSCHLPAEWVIVGSETGTGARPLDPCWVRAIRDLAKARGIPFFIKQLGASHKVSLRVLDGRTWDEFPKGFEK